MVEKSPCKEILRRICAEAGKKETSPFCREVARHLEGCPACLAQAVSLRGTVELYRCLESEEVPPGLAEELRKRLGLSA